MHKCQKKKKIYRLLRFLKHEEKYVVGLVLNFESQL